MKPQEQTQIEQDLGQWENEISFSDHTLYLRLEKSDIDIELELPNPDKDVVLLARPNGFQLFSHYNNEVRRDFAIAKSNIVSIQLLPSFTTSNDPPISLKYIAFSVIIFGVAGTAISGGSGLAIWIILGLTFGLTLSLILKKSYRQNLLMKIQDDAQYRFLLFTINKKQKNRCIEFFTNFIKEKFST
jgi:hypothetical protein